MTTTAPQLDLAALSHRWRCCTRTLRRAMARGIDVSDPAAMAGYLNTLRAPSPAMLESVLDSLLTAEDVDEIQTHFPQ